MTDYIHAERLYLDFMNSRRKFMDEAIARADFTAISQTGTKFRPVVRITKAELPEFEERIAKWESMANELGEYPDLHIPPYQLGPLPKIITDAVRVNIYEMSAVSVKNWKLSAVIAKMQAKVDRLDKHNQPDTLPLRNALNEQIEFLGKYDGDTAMYVRREGFSDTIAKIAYRDSDTKGIERISAHGLFIVDSHDLVITTETTRSRESTSVYDLIQGIESVMWQDTRLYFVQEVEEAKARLADYREKNKRQLAAASERRSRNKRKLKEATLAATAASRRHEED